MSSEPRSVISVDAPAPAGHYAQGVVAGGMLFVSGQLPIDPARGPRAAESTLPAIEDEVERALANVEAIVLAAGATMGDVVRCTVYVSDVALWPRVNQAYARFFSARTAHKPARTVVPCSTLHYGYRVEVDAIAMVRGG